jgi:dynein heavy chain 1
MNHQKNIRSSQYIFSVVILDYKEMDDPSVDPNLNAATGASITPSTANVSLADCDTFVSYLKRVCAPILDSSLENTDDIERLFTDRSSIDSIKKFISDPQCQTLLVSKTITPKEDPSANEADSATATATANSSGDTSVINSSSSPLLNGVYVLSTEVHYINPKMLSLVVLKRGQLIESDKKFHTQLRIINLVDSSPYETLHAYISHVIGPYFKSYVRESGKSEQ